MSGYDIQSSIITHVVTTNLNNYIIFIGGEEITYQTISKLTTPGKRDQPCTCAISVGGTGTTFYNMM